MPTEDGSGSGPNADPPGTSFGPDLLRRAVGYAISGAESPTARPPSQQPAPFDAEALIADLGGIEALRSIAAAARASGRDWPFPVPDRLREGLGAAQLHAAVQRASALITAPPPAVRRAAAPDADDLRLLRDVPPHHGG